MPLTIFYSWQLDLPQAVGKQFIRDALDEAAVIVAADLKLDEAERPIVDHDTKGVLGDPKIIDTIIEKIRTADIVVVDVTLTGRTVDGKKSVINSNVAYELGHAHAMRGHQVVLKLMNTHFGEPDQLPFDMQDRRFPVRFTLDPEADKATRDKQQRVLAKNLAGILADYIQAKVPLTAKFERTKSKANAAAYWDEGEILVSRSFGGGRDIEGSYASDAPLIFLRLWPDEPVVPFTRAEVNDHMQRTSVAPLVSNGYSHEDNRYGMLTFFALPDPTRLASSSQVFVTREIWGIDAETLDSNYNPEHIIVPEEIERQFARGLGVYLKKAAEFGYGPVVHFEAGLVNVERFRLYLPGVHGGRSKPIYSPSIVVAQRFDRNDSAAVKRALLVLFEKIFDEAGCVRPKNLHGFPGVV